MRATHSGTLKIGSFVFPCYNLEDGRRLISQKDFLMAIEMSRGGASIADRMLKPISHPAMKSEIRDELVEQIMNPVKFRDKEKNRIIYGYEGTVLIDYCRMILTARRMRLLSSQIDMRYARAAEVLILATAKVGIIALIDEATGYQQKRGRKALQEILDKYLSKERAAWAKTFPDSFYIEMFRLKKWDWQGRDVNCPSYAGHLTNDIIYSRLAPGVLRELQKLNPVNEAGNRSSRHHQFMTRDFGHPALREHIAVVTALMKSSSSWTDFQLRLQRVFPRLGDMDFFEFMDEASE